MNAIKTFSLLFLEKKATLASGGKTQFMPGNCVELNFELCVVLFHIEIVARLCGVDCGFII